MELEITKLIRSATPDDVLDIHNIYTAAIQASTATWDETAPSIEEMRDRLIGLQQQGFPYLVAESSSTPKIAGYAFAGPFHHQTGWRYTAEHSVYVAPNHHRHGIGRALMQELMAQLKAKGFRTLIAGVSQPGGNASLGFHRSLGFEIKGVLPKTGYKSGQWLDATLLTYDFGEPADMTLR
ncbi:MAG: N-acetyltransferase family protein, partial [Pseudomonadota bacterium]